MKLQSAMEYLMTYGWSILIIAVVLGALFGLGVFNGAAALGSGCVAQPGFLCQMPVLSANGLLSVNIGQIGQQQITVTGVGCSNTASEPALAGIRPTVVLISSQVAQGTAFLCPLISNTIGSSFTGTLWIEYTTPQYPGVTIPAQIGTLSVKVSESGVPIMVSSSSSSSSTLSSTLSSSTSLFSSSTSSIIPGYGFQCNTTESGTLGASVYEYGPNTICAEASINGTISPSAHIWITTASSPGGSAMIGFESGQYCQVNDSGTQATVGGCGDVTPSNGFVVSSAGINLSDTDTFTVNMVLSANSEVLFALASGDPTGSGGDVFFGLQNPPCQTLGTFVAAAQEPSVYILGCGLADAGSYSFNTGSVTGASDLEVSAFAWPGPVSLTISAPPTPVVFASGQSDPTYIATDGTNVYWTDLGSGTVMQEPVGGGPITMLASGQASPSGIAVSGGYVYWVDTSGGTVNKVPVGGGTITMLASGQSLPTDVATDGVNVYWTNNGGSSNNVNQEPVGGGPIINLANNSSAFGIATDGSNVYWDQYANPSGIYSVPIGGGPITTIASNQNYPQGIATDGTNVYWVDYYGSNIVNQVSVRGGSVISLAPSEIESGTGIAVDGSNVYWTQGGCRPCDVKEVPIGGGPVTILASGESNPFQIAVDNSNIYWTSPGAGLVYEETK